MLTKSQVEDIKSRLANTYGNEAPRGVTTGELKELVTTVEALAQEFRTYLEGEQNDILEDYYSCAHETWKINKEGLFECITCGRVVETASEIA